MIRGKRTKDQMVCVLDHKCDRHKQINLKKKYKKKELRHIYTVCFCYLICRYSKLVLDDIQDMHRSIKSYHKDYEHSGFPNILEPPGMN